MDLTWGKLAEKAVVGAKVFRHSPEWREMWENLRHLHDQTLTAGAAAQVAAHLTVFMLDKDDSGQMLPILLERSAKWVEGALASIKRNSHMNRADNLDVISIDTLDALVADFTNHMCAPLDLGFYAVDLYDPIDLPG